MQNFRLGDFLVEPSKGMISTRSQNLTVEPKAMAVLCELYKRQGEVVSQQELFAAVWPSSIFSPSSLQRAIAIIRKALNETSQSPKYIFTHPKLGYRLQVPKKKSATYQKAKFAFISLVTITLIAVLHLLYSQAQNSTSTIISSPLTFGETGEFNGKLSNNSANFAFLKQGVSDQIFFSSVTAPQNVQSTQLPYPVIDYVWQDNSILALLKLDNDRYSLVNASPFDTSPLEQADVFTEWQSIEEMTLVNNAELYFVASDTLGNYQLIKYNIQTGKMDVMHMLGQQLQHVSITASQQGLYFVSFDEKNKQKFGFIDDKNNIQYFDMVTPEFAEIAWDKGSNKLIFSDLLSANLFTLDVEQMQLVPLTADHNGVLHHFSSNKDYLLSTLQHEDMDIVKWQNNTSTTLNDSRHSDYLATASNSNTIAFVSNRIGHPQVFIANKRQVQLIYENTTAIAFISPPVWSPSGNKLAFTASDQLYIFEQTTNKLLPKTTAQKISRVLSWVNEETLITTSPEDNIHQFSLLSNTFSELKSFHKSNFLALDHEQKYLGVSDNDIFWGDNKKHLVGQIIRGFKFKQYLVLHVLKDGANSLLYFNNALEQTNKIAVSNRCVHVTDILSKNSYLCTEFSAADSKIVLLQEHNKK